MDYPVLYHDEQVGQVAVEIQGTRVQVFVSCQRDNSGLFRGYLLCEKGEYPLGVLEPRGERMELRRTLRAGELRALGAIWRGDIRMSYAFARESTWEPVKAAGEFFQRDPHLARGVEKIEGALWREERGQRQLALPYAPERPFPLVELFCFAQVRLIEGKSYVIYRFDREDHPALP